MPAAKQKPKNQLKLIPQQQHHYTIPAWRTIVICVLLIGVFVGLGKLFDADKPAKEIRGTAALTDNQLQSLSENDKYTSLDLRIAKLAVYKGAALQVTKNFGVLNGVDHQFIRFPVYSAGLSEYGLLTLPTTAPPASGYPVVILCHGYYDPTRYSTAAGYLGQMEYFSQHGFAVVKPDFRGQGLSISAGKAEGAYYSMAYNVDVMSLIASIKRTGYLDSSKINIWGHSMGAYVALRAAILSPDIKTVTILSGPVGNIQDEYRTYIAPSDRNNPLALLIRSNQLSEHGTPLSNPSFWDNTSPLNFVSQTHAIIQIHVGEKDRVVPPKLSAELADALSKAKKPYQYYSYPDGNHGLSLQMPDILQRSIDLINSYD